MKVHKKTREQLLMAFLSLSMIIGCSKADPPKFKKENAAAEAEEEELKPLDPAESKVILSKSALELSRATEEAKFKVPTIYIAKLTEADFVQVIRCDARFKAKTATGDLISELPESDPTRLDKLKWAWREALGRNTECKVVGTKIARNTIADLTADTGKFYYILNPCVSKERSIYEEEDCSFDLAMTNTVDYENKLKKEFLEEAQKLNGLEAKLTGHFQELYSIAVRVQYKRQACEQAHAERMAAAAFWAGIVKIVSFVVTKVIAPLIGGPIGLAAGAVLSSVIGAVFAPGIEQQVQCDEVEDLIQKGRFIKEQLSETTTQVINQRTTMAEIEEGYGKIDDKIQTENN